MKKTSLFMFAFMAALLCSMTLPAQIFFDGTPGTSAPPATLGGFNMVPFGDDTRPTAADYSDVPVPLPFTGNLGFSPVLTHAKIGDGWATWSNGYTGSVYWQYGYTITITLPDDTRAFYFYAQPEHLSTFHIEAIGESGSKATISSGPIPVNGTGGAKYFGFYTDGIAKITQIVVTAEDGAKGFAVGEFGIFINDGPPPSVPLSNWVLYLGIFLIVMFTAIRFRKMI